MKRLISGCLLSTALTGCPTEEGSEPSAGGSTGMPEEGSTTDVVDDESTGATMSGGSSEGSTGTPACEESCSEGVCVEGECLQACDPLELSCPEPTGCSAVEDDGGASVWACTDRGNADFFEECDSDADCLPRLTCIDDEVNSTCQAGCQSDFECGGGGFCNETLPFPLCVDGRWSCLGSVEEGRVRSDSVEFDVQAIDLTVGGVEGATLRLCAADDMDCSEPIGTAVANEEGRATFTVGVGPEGFSGYAEAELDGRVPGIGQRFFPITNDGDTIQVVLVTEALAGLVGGIDDAHGAVLFLTNTCLPGDTSSVTARPDVPYEDWTVTYASEANQPDPDLLDAVHGRGILGMLDPGSPTIEFLGSPVGVYAAQPVRVRANTISYVLAGPTS